MSINVCYTQEFRRLATSGNIATKLADNEVDVFPEVISLLNSHVERTVILNDITQDNNKVLGDESNKTVKFQRL